MHAYIDLSSFQIQYILTINYAREIVLEYSHTFICFQQVLKTKRVQSIGYFLLNLLSNISWITVFFSFNKSFFSVPPEAPDIKMEIQN